MKLSQKVSLPDRGGLFAVWQGGVPKVYKDIHARNSNAARREEDPRDGDETFCTIVFSSSDVWALFERLWTARDKRDYTDCVLYVLLLSFF